MTRRILAAGPIITSYAGMLPYRAILWAEYDDAGKATKYVVHKQYLQESDALSLSSGNYFECRNYPDREPERTWEVYNTITNKTIRDGFPSPSDAMHWLTDHDNDLNHGQKAGAVVQLSAPKTAVGRAWATFNSLVDTDLRAYGPAADQSVVGRFYGVLDRVGWYKVTTC